MLGIISCLTVESEPLECQSDLIALIGINADVAVAGLVARHSLHHDTQVHCRDESHDQEQTKHDDEETREFEVDLEELRKGALRHVVIAVELQALLNRRPLLAHRLFDSRGLQEHGEASHQT